MSPSTARRAQLAAHPYALSSIHRGIEKEGLRIDRQGNLALSKHPNSLGSALTNPFITTDYSEALLELITEPKNSAAKVVGQLTEIHRFVAQRNPAEPIWNQSMPARLPAAADIPVAWYGKSNSGMLKHVYREGLAWRYGKVMQCIAGLHYNYSLPEHLWDYLVDGDTAQDRRNCGYMALIRNFMRNSWLLMYLFGASPAVSGNFLQGLKDKGQLEQLSTDTFILPWATSLRMSDLGYKSPIQSELQLCYNDLDTFTARIHAAVTTPWPAYEAIGTHRDGKRIQLNTSILQIENEYYSSIRPKQITERGQRPNTTLGQRGIKYIEVRCMDIDPWHPVGISEDTCRFLDTFLLFCALEDSPMFPPPGYCQESQDNFALVAREGRRPGLQLMRGGCPVSLQDWALQIMQEMQPYAALMDSKTDDTGHSKALELQTAKVADVDLTPSAMLLNGLRASGKEFLDYTLAQSISHWTWLQEQPLEIVTLERYDRLARESVAQQAQLEAADDVDFEEYVAKFHAALKA